MPQDIEFWPLKSLSKVLEVHRDSISQSGSCLGSVRVHSLTLSYTPKSMWCDSRASSWLATLQPFCFGHKPKAMVATQMQFYHNSFSITMQLPYDYNHNLMLTSLFIHSSNITHGTMKTFGWVYFWILISTIHYDYSFKMVLNYDMWHNKKLPCGILIEFWKKKGIFIYLFKYLNRLVHSHR
jgi:hypothetical protein